jgi:hypothetical protein
MGNDRKQAPKMRASVDNDCTKLSVGNCPRPILTRSKQHLKRDGRALLLLRSTHRQKRRLAAIAAKVTLCSKTPSYGPEEGGNNKGRTML